MYRRNIETSLRKALDDTRVVLLHGARQVGKSTLAQSVAAERGGRYFTLDDAATLATARADPAALVRGTKGLTVIDEVQKAPGVPRHQGRGRSRSKAGASSSSPGPHTRFSCRGCPSRWPGGWRS